MALLLGETLWEVFVLAGATAMLRAELDGQADSD